MQLNDDRPDRGICFEELPMAFLALQPAGTMWNMLAGWAPGFQNYDKLLEKVSPHFSLALTVRFRTAQLGLRGYRDIGFPPHPKVIIFIHSNY